VIYVIELRNFPKHGREKLKELKSRGLGIFQIQR